MLSAVAPASSRQIRRRADYPSDDLGFLQRTHPLRGRPFGRLVYMADSIMQPMRRPGFGMHPHADVEVVSYVVDGTLSHRDSAGNEGVVPPGGFQCITAGTGIAHDESNRTDAPLRMFQIWFAPQRLGVAPSYDQVDSTALAAAGGFATVVAPKGVDGALGINADASIALGRFAAGERAAIEAAAGRATMLYVVEGGIAVDEEPLREGDQLRLAERTRLNIRAATDARLLLIESAL